MSPAFPAMAHRRDGFAPYLQSSGRGPSMVDCRRRRALRSVLAEAQGHRCCYCGIALAPSGAAHDAETLEHMIPVAAGGRDEWLNTVVACRLCNLGRGAMLATSYYDLVRRFGRE